MKNNLNIALYQPEIPFNTGAIARTCALTKTSLHLIKPFGFEISDKHLKRAGLDYWYLVDIKIYENFDHFLEENDANIYCATTKANKFYTQIDYKIGDIILFGPETRGLPEDILSLNPENNIKIPMINEIKRSLNLANSANIIIYEALRQNNFLTLS